MLTAAASVGPFRASVRDSMMTNGAHLNEIFSYQIRIFPSVLSSGHDARSTLCWMQRVTGRSTD
eukprot:scaffold360_cov334-Prasinococcus_capsulatus_cf.AAC.15